jgi:hypothetical protein
MELGAVATKDGNEVTNVGCGGLLLIPISTVVVAAKLLVVPRPAKGHPLGPYRRVARADDEARPLTSRSLRIVGAMFLFWTVLVPAMLAARAVMLFWTMPIALVPSVGSIWIAMFVGHLISMKLFQLLEPRLPHE